MRTHYQTNTAVKNRRPPLYASPWIALFYVLRQELTQARKSTREHACANQWV